MSESTPNTSLDRPFTPPAEIVTSRRQALELLGIGALFLATSAHATDNIITAQKFAHATTDVKVFETRNKGNGECTIVIGGLGVQDSEPIMRALLPSIGESHYTGAVRLADTGFDIDAIATGINKAHHELGFSAIHFFLHSMGGTMLADIVPRLDGGLQTKIGRVDYNCTPWTKDYVTDEAWVNIIGRLPINGSWGTKLTTQLIDRFTRPQVEDLNFLEKLNVVLDMTNDPGSPMTWTEMVRYLYDIDERHYDNLPESIISRFIAPKDLLSDTVVNLESAIEAFPKLIPGVTYGKPTLVNARGHANPRQHPDEYNRALKITPVFNSLSHTPSKYRHQLRIID